MTKRFRFQTIRPLWAVLTVATLGPVGFLVKRAVQSHLAQVSEFNPPREGPPALPELPDARPVALTLRDGTVIRSSYVPSKNGASVVYVHGSPATRTNLAPEAALLREAGYGAMLLDMPGAGESEGRATWGKPHQEAVGAALDYLASQPDIDPRRLALFGFSMGTAVVLHVAEKDRRVRAVVLAGAFTSESDALAVQTGRWGFITRLPALWSVRRQGVALEELDSTELVSRITPRPLLFVAGDRDREVPLTMTEELFARAAEPKEIVVLRGAMHGNYVRDGGQLYGSRLRAFLDRWLAPIP